MAPRVTVAANAGHLILRRAGVGVKAAELGRLPHDVELSDRVLARIGAD
jgi:hypothetical protein